LFVKVEVFDRSVDQRDPLEDIGCRAVDKRELVICRQGGFLCGVVDVLQRTLDRLVIGQVGRIVHRHFVRKRGEGLTVRSLIWTLAIVVNLWRV